MAGHSKFKNIQHRKGAQDQRRAKVFTKIIREISSAVKFGGIEPEHNSRLRNAIMAAKVANLPREKIDKAINCANGKDAHSDYSEFRYEGFLFDGIGIIIEILTDNRSRAIAEIRAAFNKYGGVLAETGSVSFMFDKVGIIEYSNVNISPEEILETSIDVGAIDVEFEELIYTVYTTVEDFNRIGEILEKKFNLSQEIYIGWRPKNNIIIDNIEKAEKLLKLVTLLEDSDNVQRVFGNYEISKEIYQVLINQ